MKKKGALSLYNTDVKFQMGVKMVYALAMVPPGFVTDVFHSYIKDFFQVLVYF